MSTGPTSSLRLEKQTAGSNLNTWGETHLNTVLDLIDSAIAGFTTIALTADTTLTSTNYVADQARSAMLKFTGTGAYTVTVPSVSKVYVLWNAQTGNLTVTTGAGATSVLTPGEKCLVFCDGSGTYRVQPTDFGSQRVTGVSDPTSAQDAATKAYVDATAFSSAGGTLPGQSGNAGRLLGTSGVTASWGGVKFQNTSTTGVVFPETTAGGRLAGLYASTSGDAGILNIAGMYRLKTDTDGSVRVFSDAEAGVGGQVLATQTFAKAFAIAAAATL